MKQKDYLSDLIIRIKNGQRAKLPKVSMHPNMPNRYLKIINLLYREGYIRGVQMQYDKLNNKMIHYILLKYNARGEPIIENLYRISTPGRRVYTSIKALWQQKTSQGIIIISTTKGILCDRDARFLNLGGEVLFGIY